ncbi:MAG: 2-oxoacid:ferredoxin oxidoreductase subunit beta [Armatimonadota bacterium]|nr:2-oxoacid:ferredoxin oxidoreductase subunit beta [Armatimonadota bacterium]
MAEQTKTLPRIPDAHAWLRVKKKFPHLWCPGCGIGIVLGATLRTLETLGYDKDDVVMVSGIGCTGRIPVYVDCNTLHTTHGRALTFATGIKLAKPNLKVITFMGDGDALAIGGNHFIHAARRNIDITAIIVNNAIYGMTGGQSSPTTPLGMKASTAVYGSIEPPFDACELAKSAGATFVARSTVYHVKHCEQMIKQGLEHHGFSVIEIISNCHTYYGRINKLGEPIDMLNAMKDKSVILTPDLDVQKAKASGKEYILGVLHRDTERPEYCDLYEKIISSANGGQRSNEG